MCPQPIGTVVQVCAEEEGNVPSMPWPRLHRKADRVGCARRCWQLIPPSATPVGRVLIGVTWIQQASPWFPQSQHRKSRTAAARISAILPRSGSYTPRIPGCPPRREEKREDKSQDERMEFHVLAETCLAPAQHIRCKVDVYNHLTVLLRWSLCML